VKISFDTNSDSYDDALSALNAAYGVESVSASSLGAIARSDMGTVPMTRDDLISQWKSLPDEYRTADFYGAEEVNRLLRGFGSEQEIRDWLQIPYDWCFDNEEKISEYLLSSEEIDPDDFIMFHDIRNWYILKDSEEE
jgi:hypothetical protein